ncbi:hypothetical protein [Phascolarctobacterium succinatutens]|uniref:hypothetical protein n=1 Tax=Phascolarctobacterium succinatutens TaxID=626940 RepID=UPI0026DC75B0|nr:hypothetical protein [Phascolarctobacterium succinatutens]
MAKNIIPEIAKMLGVELGEEFKIKEYGERIYRFDNSGLQLIYDNGVRNLNITANMALSCLLSGDIEIVKLPWKPKMDERYWTFGLGVDGKWIVIARRWEGYPCEFLLVDKGWAYRREEEAKAALPSVAKELGVEFVAKTVEENLF